MDRPKTSIKGEFRPEEWLRGPAAEYPRPAILRLAVQRPLDESGEVPFTAWYEADGRLHRVDGVAWEKEDVATAVSMALEHHWWRGMFLNGLEGPPWEEDGR